MTIDNTLLSLLQCPVSEEKLKYTDNQLVSEQSNIHYPLMRGIPWLLANPLHSMVDWSVKLNHFHSVIKHEIQSLEAQILTSEKQTKQRLQQLSTAKQRFLLEVTELVSVITKTKVASKPIYDALSDRAPNTQNLLSYEANLYRDWVWGDEENALSVRLIHDLLATKDVQHMLVIGAGAGRLALDLHQSLKPACTIANDINPLLVFSAQQIIFGNGLNITEFPMQPRNIEHVALHHQIKPIASPPQNFHLLFSDAAKPALQAATCDLVITPWVIDIQPYELSLFLNAINHYLPVGGQWLNFGSLVFNQGRDALCYSMEEIKDIAAGCGFVIEEVQQHSIPYLKSPYNAGWRMENIWCWRAIKTHSVEVNKHLQVLPKWVLDVDKKIPLSEDIKAFAFSHKTYAELASYIDGKTSLRQIARNVAKRQSMDEQEALSMLKTFYMKMCQLK